MDENSSWEAVPADDIPPMRLSESTQTNPGHPNTRDALKPSLVGHMEAAVTCVPRPTLNPTWKQEARLNSMCVCM